MYYVDGQLDNLILTIDADAVDIYISCGDDEPVTVAYWHMEEVEDDPSVAMTIAMAVELYYTDKKALMKKLGFAFKSEKIKEFVNKLK